MNDELAECGHLQYHLNQLGEQLDQYLRFEYDDAMQNASLWRAALQQSLPEEGVGIQRVIEELGEVVIPNASPIPNPGCSSFITTGATTVGALAALAGNIAAPQRIGLHAFNYLEDLSLQWLTELFQLPPTMQGIYTSGGSVANLIALGAARQRAFEGIGIDPAKSGVQGPTRVFASEESHHSILRACAILGLGRDALVRIPCDREGRMSIPALKKALQQCDGLPIAMVGNLGTTNAGVIDPISELADIAKDQNLWLHLDGAYGLPGILDPQVAHLYAGMEQADSVIVDPHKWLGAPVGIGATFVKDAALLQRAFTQEPASYLEGTLADQDFRHSLDHMGRPYAEFSVELSAPSRGAIVWALLREIGRHGLSARIQRHNNMAREMALRVKDHPNLELLREPALSICCFRYVDQRVEDLDALNRAIHRQLLFNNNNLPSTTMINGQLAIRPCFIGARTNAQQMEALLDEVISLGNQLVKNSLV